MADFLTPTDRSVRMAAIKGRGNQSTEMAIAKLFRASGITGWRRHAKVFGRPDFAFRRVRLALFVDGCFWHGCPKHYKAPVGNAGFWSTKISGNRARDQFVTKELRKRGWNVLRVWEHDVKKTANHTLLVTRVTEALANAAQTIRNR